ncbi:MAG: alpha/beta hydrolase [Candidatus Velthaea sp.]
MKILKSLALSALAFGLVGPAVTLAAGSQLEPQTQRFIDMLTAAGGPPIYTLSPTAARKVLEGAQSGPVAKLPADIDDRTIPGGPTGPVSVRIVRPKGATEALPAIVYLHGGGWILGSSNTHDRLIREIANGAHAAVIFVNYTPSPEARYPVAIEQSYAVAKFVSAHGKELNVDSSRLAIGGDSVGGDMSAALTLLAKERGGPKFRYQVLLYPVTDANFETGSYNQFANGPWLTKPAMKWFWDAYAPNVAERAKPTASPLHATLDQLTGLPPALVITDENDVLRDEGEAYAHKLMQAGVDVTAVREVGTIHDFAMLNALAETPAARNAIALTNSKLREAFAK